LNQAIFIEIFMKSKNFRNLISRGLLILLGGFFVFLKPSATAAAELFWSATATPAEVSQNFSADLMLDPAGADINAVAGRLIFPTNLLTLEKISDGGSIISFWIEAPQISSDQSVIFSGIIPGGFSGVLQPYVGVKNPGRLLTLIFKAKQEGSGVLSLPDVQVLLNDGQGTPATATVRDFVLPVAAFTRRAVSGEKTSPVSTEDKEIPENFTPQLVKDPGLFNGQWCLAFIAADAGSGISHYEVQESWQAEPANNNWQKASSPYLLQDQSLRRYIFVKAVDRAGNARLVVLPPGRIVTWYEKNIIWVIITILVLLAGSVFLWYQLVSVKSKK
jgi:hypothetical protein